MSKIALSGNASGTGTLTIVAPNTNTDRTLNLPDSAGTLATAESTLTQFSASGSAPVYAARAWVNFNGTGTVAIRASGNVSSITDNGTGDYTINFTTAMPDANYAPTLQNVGNLADGAASAHLGILTIYGALGTGATLKTTTQLRLASGRPNTANLNDSAECNVSIFR
jgi:hypothetical protein